MKVTLAIYDMGHGGAQRVLSIVANYWAARGWDVTLIMLVDRSKASFYALDPNIKIQHLGIAGDPANLLAAIKSNWQRIKVLRAAIIASQPDVVISFMNTTCVLTLLACWNSQIPVIVSEHIYPGLTDANRLWRMLMKWTYRSADLVTVLTQNALPFFPPHNGYQTIVMPNPVLQPDLAAAPDRLLPTPSLIAIGRLTTQKGFDLLLQAFHQLRDIHPNWHLTILGEGPMRSELEALRTRFQLTDRVHLPGQVQNVNDRLRQSDIFVMPSRFEGFPMALCEAMACGVAVLSTDCLSGPREIITDGVDGILVETENVDALATGLAKLMSDPTRRKQLAQAAPQVIERFGIERVMGLWDDAISQVIDARQVLAPKSPPVQLGVNRADYLSGSADRN